MPPGLVPCLRPEVSKTRCPVTAWLSQLSSPSCHYSSASLQRCQSPPPSFLSPYLLKPTYLSGGTTLPVVGAACFLCPQGCSRSV